MAPEETAVTELRTETPDGAFLRRHRELAGISLTDLAAHMGRSKGWLSKIETGKVNPPLAIVIEIADAIAATATAGAA